MQRAINTKKGMAMKTGNFSGAVFCALVCWSAAPAHAQDVYRCQTPEGKVAFSDVPCAGTSKAERLTVVPNSLDHSSAREQRLAIENERLKDQVRVPRPSPLPPATAAGGERVDSFECKKARRDYEVTANSTSSREQAIEAKRAAMYGTCGMREPDRTDIRIKNETHVHPQSNRR